CDSLALGELTNFVFVFFTQLPIKNFHVLLDSLLVQGLYDHTRSLLINPSQ
ncbi:unnamed protein product, partial [Musa banksii]